METFNKIALVTDGNRGLGRITALQLAAKGVDVIITYHSQKEEADEVVSEIKKAGGVAAALQLCIGNVNSYDLFFENIAILLENVFGTDRFDYLINNAGIGMNASFKDTAEDHFDQLLDKLYKGVFFLTQAALKYLNDGGGIVNISSRLAQACVPGYAAYATIKGAIETLIRYQAKELSGRGIRVNVVAPGPFSTDLTGGFIRNNPQIQTNLIGNTTLAHIAEPVDIGRIVAFLCSDDARWITAQRIEVSGENTL